MYVIRMKNLGMEEDNKRKNPVRFGIFSNKSSLSSYDPRNQSSYSGNFTPINKQLFYNRLLASVRCKPYREVFTLFSKYKLAIKYETLLPTFI